MIAKGILLNLGWVLLCIAHATFSLLHYWDGNKPELYEIAIQFGLLIPLLAIPAYLLLQSVKRRNHRVWLALPVLVSSFLAVLWGWWTVQNFAAAVEKDSFVTNMKNKDSRYAYFEKDEVYAERAFYRDEIRWDLYKQKNIEVFIRYERSVKRTFQISSYSRGARGSSKRIFCDGMIDKGDIISSVTVHGKGSKRIDLSNTSEVKISDFDDYAKRAFDICRSMLGIYGKYKDASIADTTSSDPKQSKSRLIVVLIVFGLGFICFFCLFGFIVFKIATQKNVRHS